MHYLLGTPVRIELERSQKQQTKKFQNNLLKFKSSALLYLLRAQEHISLIKIQVAFQNILPNLN